MIRNYFFLALVGTVGLVLQTTVWGVLAEMENTVLGTSILREFRPDLIFVLVVLVGLFKDPIHGAIMALGLGYMQDVVLGEMSGIYMTDSIIIVILARVLTRWFMATSPLNQFLCAFMLGLLDKILLIILVGVFSGGFSTLFFGLHFRFVEVLINASLAPLIYIPLSWVPGLLHAPDDSQGR